MPIDAETRRENFRGMSDNVNWPACRRLFLLTPPWLFDIYDLVAQDQIDVAIGILFAEIDNLLRTEKFTEVNNLLRVVDMKQLDSSLIVNFLALTLAPYDNGKLAQRSAFLKRARQRLMELDPNRVEDLLRSLGD